MDTVKKLFPQAFKANDVKSLVIALLVYAVIATVFSVVDKILGIIPIVGFIVGVVAWAIGIYCTIGIILAILVFLKVVK